MSAIVCDAGSKLINPPVVELFVSIFHSFKAAIADANFQLRTTKNMSIYEINQKKVEILKNCSSITNSFIIFTGILSGLKNAWNGT